MKPFLALTILVALLGVTLAEEDSRALAPLPPQTLLDILPEAPEEWKLIRSRASNNAALPLDSEAVRRYQGIPTTSSNPEVLIVIRLRDTTGEGVWSDTFAEFKEGTVNSTTEGILLDSTPAYYEQEEGRERLRTLIEGRFFVELLCRDGEPGILKEWFETIQLEELRNAATEEKMHSVHQPIKVVQIDELNPEKSRSYVASLSTEANDKITKKLIPEQYRPLGASSAFQEPKGEGPAPGLQKPPKP